MKGELGMAETTTTVFVDRFTHGLIGPDTGFFATVSSGSRIRAITPPGCWGPMITPDFRGGHEVTQPVYVEGAEVGDVLALHIEEVKVLSRAASTGTMRLNERAFEGDAFVAKKCPGCGRPWPKTELAGIGENAIRCKECGAEASPFHFQQGYTVVFDPAGRVAVAVDQDQASLFAKQATLYAALPDHSEQYPVLVFAAHELAGLLVRMRPCIGNIGTIPAKTIPDSHNAGDFGAFLIDAPHPYGISAQELDAVRTDAHLDCTDVRPGAVLLCPVKVPGGGVYMGDAHSIMGRGEVAVHSIDITADITVRVDLIKELNLPGPILLPRVQDLPPIAQPYTTEERVAFQNLAEKHGLSVETESGPIQFIGTGGDLNAAVNNAVDRAHRVLGISRDEVLNRATVTGEVQITRLPGTVQLSLMLPKTLLESRGLWSMVKEQYAL